MEFMMGGIIQFGGNFAPKDWAFCQGQLIAISENQALYAILGTTWGGDGRTNFALPDLRSRVPIGVGRGTGLTEVFQGQQRGAETQILNDRELPSHTHSATFQPTGGGSSNPITASVTVKATTGQGDQNTPTDGYWAVGGIPVGRAVTPMEQCYSSTSDTTMKTDAVQVAISGGGGGITGGTVTNTNTGENQAFAIMQPNLGMQFILAVQGTFPSRN